MVGILLMMHAPLSSAFLAAAGHVFKDVPQGLHALDVQPDQDPYEVTELAAQALLEINTGDGVLILTDVCGATPANCAQRLVTVNPALQLIYGLNVPMLLRALNYRTLPLAQLVQKTLEGGHNGVMLYQADQPQCPSLKTAV